MTLIEKLRVAQGDNAELCHMAADAIAYLKGRSSSPCNGCKGDCDGGAICTGWDWIGNNDNIQPHTEEETEKKRKLMHRLFSSAKELVDYIAFERIERMEVQCILSPNPGCYALFYWGDVKDE